MPTYLIVASARVFGPVQRGMITASILNAYRWQYIVSGVQDGRLLGALTSLITQPQVGRITAMLLPLMA